MPKVHVDHTIEANLEETWRTVRNVSDYPRYMENVRSIEVLSDEGGRRTVGWSVLLKGSILEWSEVEEIDDTRHRVEFAQIDGDLDRFDGYWQVTAIDELKTRVILDIEFEIGIPLLADMLNPVAERALRDSSRQMLQGLQHRARAS